MYAKSYKQKWPLRKLSKRHCTLGWRLIAGLVEKIHIWMATLEPDFPLILINNLNPHSGWRQKTVIITEETLWTAQTCAKPSCPRGWEKYLPWPHGGVLQKPRPTLCSPWFFSGHLKPRQWALTCLHTNTTEALPRCAFLIAARHSGALQGENSITNCSSLPAFLDAKRADLFQKRAVCCPAPQISVVQKVT